MEYPQGNINRRQAQKHKPVALHPNDEIRATCLNFKKTERLRRATYVV